MIIKELTIKNFRSYYGESIFEFSDGLTLIIGDNGDGKSTFFEAIKWLLDTSKENASLDNVSEMRKSKMEVGDSDTLSVSMVFEHNGEKSVEKSFLFERTENGFRTSNFSFRGFETNGIEREQVSGKLLMDRCFDAFIQRFSMFKGESTLNVFDNPTALKELVDKYSDVRKFDELVDLSEYLDELSRKQYDKESKSDKKIAEESKRLQVEISRLAGEISEKKRDIREKESAISIYSTRLSELEEHQDASEKYKTISEREKNKETELNRHRGLLASVNLNTSLLDKMWILCLFPNILKEFKEKSSMLSKEKRKQEKDFIEIRAKELGRLEVQKEILGTLTNGATALPWYLPDQETMEEMIHDEVCKVCGRPAHKGSPEYDFMVNKLNEFKRHLEQKAKDEEEKKKIEQKQLFCNSYIEEIHNMSISLGGTNEQRIVGIANEIKERLELNETISAKIKKLEEDVQEVKDEKARLLIQAGNVSEAVLEKDFKDIKGLFEQKERAGNRLVQLKQELEGLEKQYEEVNNKYEELDPGNSMVRVCRDVNRTLKAIAIAFRNAKELNLNQFLHELEDRANVYMDKLSAKDFHGLVRLIKMADGNTVIKLYSSNKTEIKNPSGSQETIKYISVLFAISDFTHQKRDEDYPLIFDAATSSFGEAKEQDFYNVIDNIKKQCIIVTKDFISDGEIRQDDINKLSCSVYRIKKAENFNASDLSTIRTKVTKIR